MATDNGIHGASAVVVTGIGVTGEVVPPPAPKPGEKPPSQPARTMTAKFRLKAASDTLPGMRSVRLITPWGPTTLGTVTVVHDPVVREEKPGGHASMETAQPVKLPAAVCGAIHTTEDVDYYKFTLSAPAGLVFHVTAQRLQVRTNSTYYFTPTLTLRNAAGTVLAVSTGTYGADPLLYHRFGKPGDYYLEVRDASFRGNSMWHYCVEINDRPFVTQAYPSRVMPGAAARLQLFGYNLSAGATATLAVPADLPDGLQPFLLPLPAGAKSNPVMLGVSRLPAVEEVEGDKGTPAKAQKLMLPAGVAGRIAVEGEADCYAFDAVKGQHYTFRVTARDAHSPLDGLLRLYNDKGTKLLEVDDFNDRTGIHADPRIEDWAAPETGRYVLEVRDALGRGGPNFVYFLRVARAEPHLELGLDSDKTILAPGLASCIYARAYRREGLNGEIQLNVEGLPPGIKATCGRILPSGVDGCIILEADAKASVGFANVHVTGKITAPGPDGKPRTLTARAVPFQEIHMGGGGRWHAAVEVHTVAVCGPLDLKGMRISTNNVVLKPGGSQTVEITIDRAEGFKSNVTLSVAYQHLGQIFGNTLPPGVTVDDKASFLLLTGDKVKGQLTLKADGKAAPVKDQLVPVMAHIAVTFALKTTQCAGPLRVSVVP
jgi:hypothetical protein